MHQLQDIDACISKQCQSYNERFDPVAFLRQEFLSPENVRWRKEIPLRQFHEFFKDCSPGIKVLDYGCGPTLANSISAAGRASEVVFAEYSANNRGALQQWMDRDPKAFDWSPYFDYVVQTLEGGTEVEAREREERMRKVKKILPCDLTQDNVIEQGYDSQYDVIVTVLCLFVACKTLEEYVEGVRKLKCLLKPGGKIAIYTLNYRSIVGGQAIFKIEEEVFHNLAFNAEFLHATLEQTGFCDITMKLFKEGPHEPYVVGTIFVSATKAQYVN